MGAWCAATQPRALCCLRALSAPSGAGTGHQWSARAPGEPACWNRSGGRHAPGHCAPWCHGWERGRGAQSPSASGQVHASACRGRCMRSTVSNEEGARLIQWLTKGATQHLVIVERGLRVLDCRTGRRVLATQIQRSSPLPAPPCGRAPARRTPSSARTTPRRPELQGDGRRGEAHEA